MINVKRFIEKVSLIEAKHGKDVVIPISEARGLRDELSKLLADLYETSSTKDDTEPEIQVVVKGGAFK